MSVLGYSAITAKIHSMSGKLIQAEEYDTICSLQSVDDFANYLKENESYKKGFELMGAMRLNRNKIEQILTYSLLNDFKKIYNFATLSQKRYLHFFIYQYEADIVKSLIMRFLMDHTITDELIIYEDFIRDFTVIDQGALRQAKNFDEFIESMRGSTYYDTIRQVYAIEKSSIYDYESQIDLKSLTLIWHTLQKKLKGTELELFKENYGTQIDLMNINWIYRAKKYYNMAPVEVYKVIIPINYKLHRQTLKDLVESPSLQAFEDILSTTYYLKRSEDLPDLEQLYADTIGKSKRKSEKKNPYSMASINLYLYNKTIEIQKLTIIIESLRYGLNAREKLI